MSTSTYEEVLNYVVNRVQQLSPEDQERLLDDLAAIIRQQLAARPRKHNVMEFRGMAKKFWEGVDVEQYIEEERNSWE